MDKAEYEQKRDALFTQWQEARPEYSGPGRRFSMDGIGDYEAWSLAKPKILFMMKENLAPEGWWEPAWGINTYANPFSTNIARWRQIINELYIDSTRVFSYDHMELPDSFNDIAILETKKVNEGAGSSSKSEIKGYARRDKDFITEQIEIINPNVILCGYTIEEYGDIIFGDEPWELHLASLKNCNCYKHRNRLVIDFYHPSTRSPARERELSEILNQILKEGVFSHFDW